MNVLLKLEDGEQEVRLQCVNKLTLVSNRVKVICEIIHVDSIEFAHVTGFIVKGMDLEVFIP